MTFLGKQNSRKKIYHFVLHKGSAFVHYDLGRIGCTIMHKHVFFQGFSASMRFVNRQIATWDFENFSRFRNSEKSVSVFRTRVRYVYDVEKDGEQSGSCVSAARGCGRRIGAARMISINHGGRRDAERTSSPPPSTGNPSSISLISFSRAFRSRNNPQTVERDGVRNGSERMGW